MNWNQRCAESIAKEKAEIAKRYNIRFGQTEIYCTRCGRPVANPENHTCQDIRFERLRKERDEKMSKLKKSENKALLILSDLGARKAAILLMIPERTITNWIQRKSIPGRHIEKVLNL